MAKMVMEKSGQAMPLLRHDGDGFKVDESAFYEILHQDDLLDRKLVVVSIVGEYRRGKSFFLNFVMRYLLNQGNPDWMSESESRLEGFSWRRGTTRETDGIVMWSRAFPLGDEYAVVLLDTEGTYDEQSTNKTMSHVFACSALISSLQIFNVHEKINKHTMHEIQAFAEFGRLASCAEAKTAFQKLMFLVRDWAFEEDFEFGIKGGHKYLNHWLKNDKDGVKDTMKTCFSHVSCYMMPYPGDKVKNDQNFAGNLTDMEPKFSVHLKQLVELIFSSDYLESKMIGGKNLKLKDFMIYFSMFAKTLNDSGVEPKSLFQAQVESCNMKAKEIALEIYRSNMDDITQGDDPLDDIKNIHEGISKQATNAYDEQPKMGGNENGMIYKKILIHEISLLFAKYQNADTHKRVLKSKMAEKEKQLWEAENKRIMEKLEHKHAIETARLEQYALKEEFETEQQRQAEEFKLQIHRMEQEAATERMRIQCEFQENIAELKSNQEFSAKELKAMKEMHEREMKEAKANADRMAAEMRDSGGGCTIL